MLHCIQAKIRQINHMSKKEEIVHARVPKEVYYAIDKKAEELQKESYGEVTRSDVVRLAITEFISDKSNK